MLQTFQYEGRQIRAIEKDGVPWFVGMDAAEILGYSNPRDALSSHVDREDKTIIQKSEIPTLDIPNRGLTIINESGLYSLIMSSKLPSAKRFKRWVTSEVLPAIRRHGAYATPATIDRIVADPDFGIQLLTELKKERQKREAAELQNAIQAQQIAEMKPKVGYYDTVLASQSLVKTSVIAKDYGMSAISFNQLLHKLGIQYRQ